MKKSLLLMAAASFAFGAAAQLAENTEYFIRNSETGLYMTGGFSWGTLAVTKETGRAFELVAVGENQYNLKSSCGFLKDGGVEAYVDGNEGEAITITILPTENNRYIIKKGDLFYGINEVIEYQNPENWNYQHFMAENTIHSLKWHEDEAEAINWEFLTREDMIAALADASVDAPADAFFYVKGYNTEINDADNDGAWAYTKNGEAADIVYPSRGWTDWGEQWCNKSTFIWCLNDGGDGAVEGTDVLAQEIEGMVPGLYEASYRLVNQNNSDLVLRLNDTEAKAFEYEDTDLWYMSAYEALHKNELKDQFTVAEDGKLSIRMEKTIDPAAQNRFAFKSIRLRYLGASTAVNTIASDENGAVEYFNLQGVRVANPENGLFIKRQGNKVSKVVIR